MFNFASLSVFLNMKPICSKEIINNNLYDFIIAELFKKGIKATTMDSLAASLQMSKRTLYEIFGSKDEMVERVLKKFYKESAENYKALFESSDNIMEALLKCLRYNRQIINKVSVDFIKDFALFKSHKENSCNDSSFKINGFTEMLKMGAQQGYFRNDINFIVQGKILSIQMEALKRMEELFPSDISIVEVYDSISLGFLRSIASEKGLKLIDNINITQ